MPYKFGEYVSTYVDPQSVAISETLRNRFMENFKANDQLTMAVEQMKAALPFENDVAKKKELENQVNQKLETLSSRGDYENLGFAVHKATKEFSTAYAPIKENYDRYQAALKELDEQYKKGDINAEDYNMATSYIVKGYKGFEVDPATGKVKEGTMYSSPTIYKDPKLMDKIKERLEILYEKKTGQKSSNAGLDANGVWKVTSGQTITEIPEQDVMDVYNSVIQEPDVRMYLDQRADMKLHMADRSGNTGAYLDAKLKSNQSAIEQINQAIASNQYSAADKKSLATQITALAEENKQIQAAKADPNLASNYLRSQFRDEILDPIKQYALKKAGVRERTSEYSYENNYAIQLDAIKRRADMVSLSEYGDVTAADDMSGSTTDEKTNYLSGIDQQIADLEAKIAAGGVSQDLMNKYKSDLTNNINEKSRIEGQLKAAADKSISMAELDAQDPTLVNVVRRLSGYKATAGEVYTQMQKIFSNVNGQDYTNFKTEFDRMYGDGALEKHLNQYYPAVGSGSAGYSATPGGTLAATEGMTQEQRDLYYGRTGTGSTSQVLNTFNNKFEPKVNSAFKEVKTAVLFDTIIDVGDPAKTAAVTKMKDAYFKDKMPFENQYFIVNGEKKSGKDLAAEGYVMKSVTTNLLENKHQIHMEKGGDSPTSLTAIYDGRQITSPELQAAMNDPEVRLGALISQHDTRTPGATSTIKTITFNGRPVDFNVVSQGDATPIITLTEPSTGKDLFTGGEPTKLTANDTQLKNAISKGWLKF